MKQINKNIILNAVGNTFYNALQWLITVAAARHGGFEMSGILSVAMSFTLTFRTVAYFGIRNYQVSDVENRYSFSDYTLLRKITSAVSIILCLTTALMSGYKADSLSAIFWFAIFRMSESFSDLYQGHMQKNNRLDKAGICLIIKSVISTAVFFIVYSISTLNCGLMGYAAVSVICTFALERNLAEKLDNETIRSSFLRIKSLAAETYFLPASLFLTYLVSEFPKYILSVMTDNAVVGIYSAVFSMAQIIQAIFEYIYIPCITPSAELISRKDYSRLNKLILRQLSAFAAITAVFAVIMYFIGVPVISGIYGDDISDYKYMLMPAVFSVCAFNLMKFSCALATVMRRMKLMLFALISGVAASMAFSVIMLYITDLPSSVSFGVIVGSVIVSAVIGLSLIQECSGGSKKCERKTY